MPRPLRIPPLTSAETSGRLGARAVASTQVGAWSLCEQKSKYSHKYCRLRGRRRLSENSMWGASVKIGRCPRASPSYAECGIVRTSADLRCARASRCARCVIQV